MALIDEETGAQLSKDGYLGKIKGCGEGNWELEDGSLEGRVDAERVVSLVGRKQNR